MRDQEFDLLRVQMAATIVAGMDNVPPAQQAERGVSVADEILKRVGIRRDTFAEGMAMRAVAYGLDFNAPASVGPDAVDRLLIELEGLRDQIVKGHFLNAHFRAFQISHAAWQEHTARGK